MVKEGFYYLGRILKPHGNKGQLIVHLDVDEPEKYSSVKSVYLDLYGERVPYFIRSIELKHHQTAIVSFEDIDNAEDASLMAGLELYLPEQYLPELRGNQFYHHEIIGFEVHDKNLGAIGTVVSVLDLPHQSMLQIKKEGKEILIPLVDEIVRSIDKKKKTLNIVAPDGLIEIYL